MFANKVPFNDFKERRMKCKNEADKRGLSGLMIWSRGGGTFDRYADVDFLANYYQQRCYLPDHMPFWSGRSHCVLLISVEAEPVLIVSSPEYRKDLVTVEDVRYGVDFIGECVKAMKELGMDHGKLGLIGGDVFTFANGQTMVRALPDIEWIPSDDILTPIRMVKSPREIECIKEACRIGTEAVKLIMNNITEGKTESEVIAPAIAKIIAEGAALYFVVTSSGPYCNAAHSIDFPGYDGQRKLERGEIFRVDLILSYQGYLCDFGRSAVVGNTSTIQQKELLDRVKDACEYVVSHIKPGISIRELCSLGDKYLTMNGISLSADQTDPSKIYAAYPPHWGHSLGMTWERPWMIEEENMVLKSNMYLAIEKSLYQPGVGTVFYEHNLIVTEVGNLVLTQTE